MDQPISPKIISLTFGVLVVLFAFGFYIFAWQEPTAIPPGGNVDAPINVGATTQSKAGALGVGGVLQVGSFSMLSGAGAGKVLTSDASGLGSWQTAAGSGIPSGMIAMFDAACPSGWTRFAALDNRFPLGALTYGTVGGSVSHTHSIDPPLTAATPDGPMDYVLDWGNGAYIVNMGGEKVDISPFTSGSGGDYPPYLGVVWCKKN